MSNRGFDTEHDFQKRSLTGVQAKQIFRIMLLALRSGFRRWIQLAQVYRSDLTRSVFIPLY